MTDKQLGGGIANSMRSLGYRVTGPSDPDDCTAFEVHCPDGVTILLAKDEHEAWQRADEHWRGSAVAGILISNKPAPMPTNPDLAALSAAATQGEWDVETGHIQRDSGGIRYWQISDGQDAIACNQFCYAGFKPEVNEANAAFIVALVNAYRTGNLVQIDREGIRERVASHVHGVLSRANVTAYLDMPEETAGWCADAAIAAILGGE